MLDEDNLLLKDGVTKGFLKLSSWEYLSGNDVPYKEAQVGDIYAYGSPASSRVVQFISSKGIDFSPVQDVAFLDFVKGKRVAIIGPSQKISEEDCTELSEFDLIVRMNFRQVSVKDDPLGGVCHINYFSSKQLANLGSQQCHELGECLAWVVVESLNKVKEADILLNDRLNAGIRSMEARAINELCSYTNFTALPKIVFDLLLHRASFVKIFYADLMLTVNRVAGYVPESWQWNDMHIEFLNICSKLHDPVPQFLWLKHLFNHRLIVGDKRFTQVMELSLDEYIFQLASIYGKSGAVRLGVRLSDF
jgi:hypothetical protein